MTGRDMARLRKRLGLSYYEFGLMLGYQGNQNNIARVIRRYERLDGRLPPGLHLRCRTIDLETAAREIKGGDLV